MDDYIFVLVLIYQTQEPFRIYGESNHALFKQDFDSVESVEERKLKIIFTNSMCVVDIHMHNSIIYE